MRRLLFIVVAACVTVAVASPAVARAATPCYKQVIADWSADGVINGHLSAACLRKAIKKTPEDLRDYSSIIDDINAALLGGVSVKNGTNNDGGTPGPGATGGGGRAERKQGPETAHRRDEQT